MLHCFDLFSSKIWGGGKSLTFCFDTGVGRSQIVKIFHWFFMFQAILRPFNFFVQNKSYLVEWYAAPLREKINDLKKI